MSDHDDGQVQAFIDVLEQIKDRFRRLRVKGRSRFVAQQHLWVTGQGAGNADTLLLAAGKLTGIIIPAVLQLYQFQQRLDPLFDLVLRQPLDLQRESDVIVNCAGGQQVKVLEDHPDILSRFA